MMVSFDLENTRFHLRAAGLIEHDGWVLLCRSHNAPGFWFLPGGRVEMYEPTPDTVVREMREELGAEVELGPLTWVVENFFSMEGRRYHEVGLYYRVSFKDPACLEKDRSWNNVVDATYKIDLRWFRLEELDQLEVRPHFLREALRNPPAGVGHIVHVDGKSRPA